jgi:hypothetical protein
MLSQARRGVRLAGRGARQQQLALAQVACERGGAFELGMGFFQPAELEQKVAAHAGQQVVVFHQGLGQQRVGHLQPRGRAEGHGQAPRRG